MANPIPMVRVSEASAPGDAAASPRAGNGPGQDAGQPFSETLAKRMDGGDAAPPKPAQPQEAAEDLPPDGESLPPDALNLLAELLDAAGADVLDNGAPALPEADADSEALSPEELALLGAPGVALATPPVQPAVEPVVEEGAAAVSALPSEPELLSATGAGEAAANLLAEAGESAAGGKAGTADAFAQALAAADSLAGDGQADVTAPLSSPPIQQSAAPDKAQSAPPFADSIDTPVDRPQWGESVGSRVVWLVNQNQQSAELRLNPPHLGPLEVRITVHQDQASVSFTAQHAMTRDALESAVPRLRDMLGEQGLSLVNVDISQHSFAEHREGRAALGQGPYAREQGEGTELGDAGARRETVIVRGLVDYYA